MGSPSIPLLTPFFDGSGSPQGPQMVVALGKLNRIWVLFLDSLGVGNPPPIVATVTAPYNVGPPVPLAGQILGVILTQDSIGGHAIAWPSSLFASSPTAITTPGSVTVALFVGSGGFWWYAGAVSGGGGSGSVLSLDETLSAPFNVTAAAPPFSLGSILAVRLLQDGTGGHAVTWGAGFAFTDAVPTGANLVSLFMFFGAASGLWELCAAPILGRYV